MAELTPLDEKLGEVLGLAQAAQAATQTVAKLAEHDEIVTRLDRMRSLAQGLHGRLHDGCGLRAGQRRCEQQVDHARRG